MKKRFWSYISNYKFHSIFVKNLIFSLVLIIAPLSIILAIAVNKSNETMSTEIQYFAQNHVENNRRGLDFIFRDVIYLAASLSRNFRIQRLLHPPENQSDYQLLVSNILVELQNLTNRNIFVELIYVYSHMSDDIVTSAGQMTTNHAEIQEQIRFLQERNSSNPILIAVKSATDTDADSYTITLLKPIIDLRSPELIGLIGIRMNSLNFSATIKKMTPDGKLTILSDEGTTLHGINAFTDFSSVTESDEPGTYLTDDYIVATEKSSDTDLRYILGIPLSTFERQYGEIRELSVLLILISVAAALVASAFLSWNSYLPIRNVLAFFEDTSQINLSSKKHDEIRFIISSILKILRSNATLSKELDSQLDLLDHTKAAALQAQINPHFLYNTLDTIRWGAIELSGGDNSVAQMISDLADLLRLGFETNENKVSIDTEKKHAQIFTRLLSARYPSKLNVVWNIEQDISTDMVLKLCLQPIIENAFYHGIKPLRKAGNITITGFAQESRIILEVHDDGRGMTPAKLKRIRSDLSNDKSFLQDQYIGILNVHQRIQLVFGKEYGIKVSSNGKKGTSVIMTFPKITRGTG